MEKSLEQAPLVSVVCTVYNKGKWLRQTIESFLEQKEISFEIILIDDASTDNSKEIIQSFAELYPNLIIPLYNSENLGIAKTWKKACISATGKYIARCDGDDYWLDDHKLFKQVQCLESRVDSLWCGTDIDFVDINGLTTAKAVFANYVIDIADTYEKMIATRGFTAPSTWLVERQIMLKVNAMLDDDKETADDTFNLQLDLFHETAFTFLPDVTVAYRVNEGSDSRPQSFEALQKRFDQLLKTQFYYLDKYPETDYKEILRILLERHNMFEKELSQHDFIHSKVNSQKVTIYYTAKNESFSQNKILEFQLQYRDTISFTVPDNTNTLRIDLSELASFYQKISLVDNEFETELLPDFTNGRIIGSYVMFNDNDPQLIYDVSRIKSKTFTLTYAMFNVDKIDNDDYIAKVLSRDLLDYRNQVHDLTTYKIQFEQADEERKRYKQELEEMVVRYNSVTHSRRWTIPTAIINFFRRRK